jgi:hypothetical protein
MTTAGIVVALYLCVFHVLWSLGSVLAGEEKVYDLAKAGAVRRFGHIGRL